MMSDTKTISTAVHTDEGRLLFLDGNEAGFVVSVIGPRPASVPDKGENEAAIWLTRDQVQSLIVDLQGLLQ